MKKIKPKAIIDEMVRRIVKKFDPDQVVLFGSHARETAGPDSDVDLLVIMPVKGSRDEQCVEIRLALRGMGLSKDIVLVTPEEAKRYRHLIGTIIYPAFREGKILYERSAASSNN
jgi:predicted nucleotidyltransferase